MWALRRSYIGIGRCCWTMIELSQNAKGAIILAIASVIGTVIAQQIAGYLKRNPSADRKVDVTFVSSGRSPGAERSWTP